MKESLTGKQLCEHLDVTPKELMVLVEDLPGIPLECRIWGEIHGNPTVHEVEEASSHRAAPILEHTFTGEEFETLERGIQRHQMLKVVLGTD
jgi:hypothetical protein